MLGIQKHQDISLIDKMFQHPNMEGKIISCLQHALYFWFPLSVYIGSRTVLKASVQHFDLGWVWIIIVTWAKREGHARAEMFQTPQKWFWRFLQHKWLLPHVVLKSFLCHITNNKPQRPSNKCKFLSVLRNVNKKWPLKNFRHLVSMNELTQLWLWNSKLLPCLIKVNLCL